MTKRPSPGPCARRSSDRVTRSASPRPPKPRFDLASRLRPDVIVLDVRLPGLDGLTALGRLREITHNAPVIVMTAHGNLTTAVRAVEGGAFDYLAKPFDLAQALDAVSRALASRTRPVEEPTPTLEPDGEELVGRSLAMQAVFKRIALVAPTDASVLITGESGTGKELVARAVHRHSLRKDRPFIPVHVAALNPNLVESELFGHVKGAFTGAAQTRPGLLALADGGTVFLDELGDIPLPVQAKLLRVLEHQEVLPVGGGVPTKINVRVLAATHSDLLKQVNAGQFRHDLYFRLNVFEIQLPTLRDRTEDIWASDRSLPPTVWSEPGCLRGDDRLLALADLAGERARIAERAGACGHRRSRRATARRAFSTAGDCRRRGNGGRENRCPGARLGPRTLPGQDGIDRALRRDATVR